MKVLAIILNIFIPGLGSLIVGKIIPGIIQLILFVVAFFLCLTGFLAIIGVPIGLINFVWAIVTAATADNKSLRQRQ